MTVSRALVAAASLALLAMAGVVAAATGAAWVPCDAGLYAEGCLLAMDQPANSAVIGYAWLVAGGLTLVIALWSLHVSSPLSPRVAFAALGAVALVNPIADYVIAMAFWADEGLWDAPPGMGYPTAVGLGIAGVLLLWTAASMPASVRRATPTTVEVAAPRHPVR